MINLPPNTLPTAADGAISTLPGAPSQGSAANLATQSTAGSRLVASPGEWSQAAVPVSATQASTQKAAVAGIRHICRSISACFSTGANAQAAQVSLILRDGAAGVGAQLWAKTFILNLNSIFTIDLSGLNIVGTLGNAMTLEFTVAGVAGSFQSVALTGYDAQ